jgi:hypothetical protein
VVLLFRPGRERLWSWGAVWLAWPGTPPFDFAQGRPCAGGRESGRLVAGHMPQGLSLGRIAPFCLCAALWPAM